MRILVVCQHYWPEPFNTADVCEELVARGHSVAVLTGMPNTGMPNNEIAEGYRGCGRFEEERNGVRIIRVPLHPRKSGAVNRVRNYLTFWRNACREAEALDGRFDVVLGYQFSPVMQVDPGIRYAREHGIRMLLYCFDLWPESLCAGGFSKSSLPFKWMKRVSKRIYSQADRIAVTSPLFDAYFRNELGLDLPDSVYLPQYADDAFLGNATQGLPDGFDSSKTNLTFAGNVGRAQSVTTVIEAANLLKSEETIGFHIVGSGSMLEECRALAKSFSLKNIAFHGRKSLEEMPAFYAASDAMIATFEDSPIAEYTLPRKVTTYLAAGKPVLAAASGETRRVIDTAQCGLTCEFQDAEGLAHICEEFLRMTNRQKLGRNARAYYEKHFTKELFFSKLESELGKLAEGTR